MAPFMWAYYRRSVCGNGVCGNRNNVRWENGCGITSVLAQDTRRTWNDCGGKTSMRSGLCFPSSSVFNSAAVKDSLLPDMMKKVSEDEHKHRDTEQNQRKMRVKRRIADSLTHSKRQRVARRPRNHGPESRIMKIVGIKLREIHRKCKLPATTAK